ncbi:MAG TPA: dockerin type I repeat-containing protein, partial [Bacteroidota bacterium]|nr:dockerin type I repeat-containing protein [Bacteroidota bacterium]
MKQTVTLLLGAVLVLLFLSEDSIAQTSYVCGDVNDDGRVDVADLNYLVNYLRFGGPPPTDLTKADLNVTAAVDTADIEYLVNYLFFGGPPPLCFTSFHPTSDTTLASGTYWFYDFEIPPGVTVTYQDSVTLNVLNSFLIDLGGGLTGSCIPIVINHLSQLAPLKIFGKLIDTCGTPGMVPASSTAGRVVIRSAGAMVLGGDSTMPQAEIRVEGELFIGDPWFSSTSIAKARAISSVSASSDTVFYTYTSEDSAHSAPVCNMIASFPSSNPSEVQFSLIEKDPFRNAITRRVLYFGDGDSVVNPSSVVTHTYDTTGGFVAAYEVTDDDTLTSAATAVLRIPQKQVFAFTVLPFAPDSLVQPAGT